MCCIWLRVRYCLQTGHFYYILASHNVPCMSESLSSASDSWDPFRETGLWYAEELKYIFPPSRSTNWGDHQTSPWVIYYWMTDYWFTDSRYKKMRQSRERCVSVGHSQGKYDEWINKSHYDSAMQRVFRHVLFKDYLSQTCHTGEPTIITACTRVDGATDQHTC